MASTPSSKKNSKTQTTETVVRSAASRLRKIIGTDPAIHAGALRLAGLTNDSQLSKTEYKKILDRFLKSRPNAKRR